MNEIADLPGNTYVATATSAASATAARLDLYTTIHKALRAFMGHVLQRVGNMDVNDAAERGPALDGVESLLALMRSHLRHEDDFIHTAIEARRPGGARHTADDHRMHAEALADLEDEARALRVAHEAHRAALAQRLYRHLATFIGENLQHMHAEETQNNAALWALYSDDELADLHDRLIASIAPDEMALAVRWMAAALSIDELAGLFGEMQKKAPPPAFEALLDVARRQLDERRWARLARALGRAPVPGLMTA
jgi:hypothetical protein